MTWTHTSQQPPTKQDRISMLLGRRKKSGDPLEQRIDCLIGSDTSLEGDLIFTGGLRIDGRVTGDVTVASIDAGTLTIGDQGCIEGEVRVSHLIVYGEIRGTVYATGLVDLRPNARIFGDVHYSALEMQVGAQIVGHLVKHRAPGEMQ
jgi:cytoskeletal protein CcmA (bactofilin family)